MIASGEEFRKIIDFFYFKDNEFCLFTCESISYVFELFTQIKMNAVSCIFDARKENGVSAVEK